MGLRFGSDGWSDMVLALHIHPHWAGDTGIFIPSPIKNNTCRTENKDHRVNLCIFVEDILWMDVCRERLSDGGWSVHFWRTAPLCLWSKSRDIRSWLPRFFRAADFIVVVLCRARCLRRWRVSCRTTWNRSRVQSRTTRWKMKRTSTTTTTAATVRSTTPTAGKKTTRSILSTSCSLSRTWSGFLTKTSKHSPSPSRLAYTSVCWRFFTVSHFVGNVQVYCILPALPSARQYVNRPVCGQTVCWLDNLQAGQFVCQSVRGNTH